MRSFQVTISVEADDAAGAVIAAGDILFEFTPTGTVAEALAACDLRDEAISVREVLA